MKRYLVFGWEAWEASGGFGDFLKDFDNFEEAEAFIREYIKGKSWPYGEVIDITKPVEEALVFEISTR